MNNEPYHYVAGGIDAASSVPAALPQPSVDFDLPDPLDPPLTPDDCAAGVTGLAEDLLREWFQALRGASRAYMEFSLGPVHLHRVVFVTLGRRAVVGNGGYATYTDAAVALRQWIQATLHTAWLTAAAPSVNEASEDGLQPILIVRRDPLCQVYVEDHAFNTGDATQGIERGLKLTMRLAAWSMPVHKVLEDLSVPLGAILPYLTPQEAHDGQTAQP